MVVAAKTNRRWPAILLVVLAVVASSVVQAPHADAKKPRPKCFGKRATIVGNKKSNTIKGTKKADVIVGLGGNDRIIGGGGADRICGGVGADDLQGGKGNDRIDGGKGRDNCRQQAGTGPKKRCEGPKFQLAVTKAGTGTGKVTSSPPGIDCGQACALGFIEGQSVTLTATPSSGSSFEGWEGVCTGVGLCAVPMWKARSVVATFTANPAPPPQPVNDPPVANDDSASTDEDTPVVINVLANDFPGPPDESGQTLTVHSVTQPAHGSAANNGDGTVTYTPDLNYNGSDSLTYRFCDNGSPSQCDTASVTVSVAAANDAPVANDDVATTNEDVSVTVNVVANDTDPEGNLNPSSMTIIAGPFNGSGINHSNGTMTYSPSANWNGIDLFQYRVCDTTTLCDTATVSITVNSVNDNPVANNDSATVAEDSGANSINVVANDNDGPDVGETLTVTVVTQGNNGSAAVTGAETVSYTPNADFFGNDSFTYTISDGNGGTASATVNVTVTNVNDPPVANDDSATTDEDTAVTISVLANDNDGPDVGETLTVTLVTQGDSGSVAITGGGTQVSYTPNADFFGSDSFTYTISDGNGGTATATVSVTVNNLFKLTVNVVGNGSVTSVPAGISCPGDCTQKYNPNTTVQLTASGGVFVGWSGNVPASCTVLPDCTVVMDQDRVVTASFTG